MSDPNLSGRTPAGMPAWLWYAVHDLYHEMERIAGEALDQGQRDQDPESDRFTWCREVATLIDLHRIADEMAVKNRLLAEADRYEKDGQPGPLGFNGWGWRDIARAIRQAADF